MNTKFSTFNQEFQFAFAFVLLVRKSWTQVKSEEDLYQSSNSSVCFQRICGLI